MMSVVCRHAGRSASHEHGRAGGGWREGRGRPRRRRKERACVSALFVLRDPQGTSVHVRHRTDEMTVIEGLCRPSGHAGPMVAFQAEEW